MIIAMTGLRELTSTFSFSMASGLARLVGFRRYKEGARGIGCKFSGLVCTKLLTRGTVIKLRFSDDIRLFFEKLCE